MPLADESIVQISGVEKSNVIDDDGEFLLAIQGDQHARQGFFQVRESVDALGQLSHSDGDQ